MNCQKLLSQAETSWTMRLPSIPLLVVAIFDVQSTPTRQFYDYPPGFGGFGGSRGFGGSGGHSNKSECQGKPSGFLIVGGSISQYYMKSSVLLHNPETGGDCQLPDIPALQHCVRAQCMAAPVIGV